MAPDLTVGRDFTKGGGMSAELLSVTLRQFSSAAVATKAFNRTRSILKTCHREQWEGSNLTYARMSAPQVGDASFGVKLSIDGTDFMQNYVLAGPTVLSVNGGGLMTSDADALTAITASQVNRYLAASKS